jgi:hypothetical protein
MLVWQIAKAHPKQQQDFKSWVLRTLGGSRNLGPEFYVLLEAAGFWVLSSTYSWRQQDFGSWVLRILGGSRILGPEFYVLLEAAGFWVLSSTYSWRQQDFGSWVLRTLGGSRILGPEFYILLEAAHSLLLEKYHLSCRAGHFSYVAKHEQCCTTFGQHMRWLSFQNPGRVLPLILAFSLWERRRMID